MTGYLKTALSFFAAVFLTLALAIPVGAAGNVPAADEVSALISGIENFKMRECGAENIRDWINTGISEKAGIGSEWYILPLRNTDCDLSAFSSALWQRIENSGKLSASTSIKYALFLLAAGDGTHDEYVKKCADECIGEQGIMSLIFGLHLLNNGVESELFTTDGLIERLLSEQLPDDGWAVRGEHGDTDVTAMALQALAPYYDTDESVREAADKALSLLSGTQLEDGDYNGFGKPNLESTAQVLAALSALDIDFSEDSRFIKNGNTLLDGMKKYLLPDGSFSHEQDSGFNETATVQAYYCLYSYKRMLDGGNIYIFESRSEPVESIPEPDVSETASPEKTEAAVTEPAPEIISETYETPAQKTTGISYKIVAIIVILASTAVVCAMLFIAKKRSLKNYIFALAVMAALMLFVVLTDFKSAENYYGSEVEKENVTGAVTFSISCGTLIGESGGYIPADGFILPVTEFAITDGETVRDILIEAAKKYGIQLDCNADGYVRGIGCIYEFDYGDMSGWMYRVNGEFPSVNCGSFVLSDGDNVEWLYTRNIGLDIE